VSEGFAHANHLGPGSTVEALINGKSRQVHIVCIALSPEYIYAIRAGSFMPDDKHYGIFWMTREALTDIAGFGGSFNALAIALSPGTKPPDVLKSVDRILDPYGNPGAYARDKQLSNVFLNNELYQLQVMGYSIPIIFLGVAAFLLHIVIGRLINRQREQIATLKAVGYSNLQVGLHYLSIVTFMTLSGALPAILPGIWLGQWTTEMYKDYMKLPDFHFVFDPMVPLWGILFAIVASFLGALSSLKAVMKLKRATAAEWARQWCRAHQALKRPQEADNRILRDSRISR
jgi:putative ABC transport system permease protein